MIILQCYLDTLSFIHFARNTLSEIQNVNILYNAEIKLRCCKSTFEHLQCLIKLCCLTTCFFSLFLEKCSRRLPGQMSKRETACNSRTGVNLFTVVCTVCLHLLRTLFPLQRKTNQDKYVSLYYLNG